MATPVIAPVIAPALVPAVSAIIIVTAPAITRAVIPVFTPVPLNAAFAPAIPVALTVIVAVTLLVAALLVAALVSAIATAVPAITVIIIATVLRPGARSAGRLWSFFSCLWRCVLLYTPALVANALTFATPTPFAPASIAIAIAAFASLEPGLVLQLQGIATGLNRHRRGLRDDRSHYGCSGQSCQNNLLHDHSPMRVPNAPACSG
jgi:hypothetical protein